MPAAPSAHLGALLVVAGYLAALFVATWLSQKLGGRGAGGATGYLLAGRDLPTPVVAALLAGLAVGGASTIGVAEQAYTRGLGAGWYNAAWAAGAAVLGLYAAPRYRRLEITTLPELFERHYGLGGRVLGVVGQLVIQVVVTTLQYVAGGAILTALLPGLFTLQSGMAVTAAVFVAITLVGGFWAAGITNIVNVLVIYVGIVLGVVLTIGRIGDLGTLARALPAGHPGYSLGGVGGGVVLAWFIVMVTMTHSTQSVIQIGFAARDARTSGRGYLWGALLIAPVGFLSAMLGLAAAALHPGIVPAQALPRVVLELNPLASGLVLAGLWAADVSTASAMLLGSATLVSQDIVRRFLAPGLPSDREKALCRWIVVGLSIVTFALALTVRGILPLLTGTLALSSAYTLIVLMTMLRPRWCRRSTASWTLAATMLVLAAWLLGPPAWRLGLPHPVYATWAASLVAFAVVAVADRRRIPVPDVNE